MPTGPAARADWNAATPVDLLVLAGGRGSRLGGALKPAVDVAGRTLLSRVLDARPLVRHTVIVAPDAARPAAGAADPSAGTPPAAGGGSARFEAGDLAGPATAGRDCAAPATLTWALEDPPFGGPVAGIAAGLAALDAADTPEPAEWLLVLACDLPWAAAAARHLLTALADAAGPADPADPTETAPAAPAAPLDGLYLVDDTGRDQWLVGVYRASALRAGAARLGHAVHGASVRQLLTGLTLRGLPDAAQASADVDTWQDVTLSTERLRAEHPEAGHDPHSPDPDSPDPDSPDPHSPDPYSPRSTAP